MALGGGRREPEGVTAAVLAESYAWYPAAWSCSRATRTPNR